MIIKFDDEFRRSAIQSLQLAPVRLVLAAVLWWILFVVSGKGPAAIWLFGALAGEIVYQVAARLVQRAVEISVDVGWAFSLAHGLTVCAWSMAGLFFWRSGQGVGELAAIAFFTGHLLYVQAHHGASPPLLLASLPVLLAPAIVAADPHYQGLEQLALVILVTAAAGHALTGFYTQSAVALMHFHEPLQI